MGNGSPQFQAFGQHPGGQQWNYTGTGPQGFMNYLLNTYIPMMNSIRGGPLTQSPPFTGGGGQFMSMLNQPQNAFMATGGNMSTPQIQQNQFPQTTSLPTTSPFQPPPQNLPVTGTNTASQIASSFPAGTTAMYSMPATGQPSQMGGFNAFSGMLGNSPPQQFNTATY